MPDVPAPLRSRSPQRPSDLVGEWQDVGADGIRRAVETATAAQPAWSAAGPAVRAATLERAASAMSADRESLADLVVREVGKPVGEALAEVDRAVAILRFYAQAAYDPDGETHPAVDGRSWLMSRRRPRGVVGLITPWNFPIAIPIWKLAPAIAWGNTVVLKPAREAMACALRVASYLEPAAGAVNVVTASAVATRAWLGEPGVDALTFTGSAAVGREVALAATAAGIPFQVEMGGSNASIVFPDADLATTARTVAAAAMSFAGQKCTVTRRVIVVGPEEPFVEALQAEIAGLQPADPAKPGTSVGPVISNEAAQRVVDAAERARRAGARIIAGGRRADEEGFFVTPLLATDVPRDDVLACEEVFGPVTAVFRVHDEAEAAALADATDYGLVSSIFTADLGRAMRLVDRLETGLVRVNAPTTGVDFHAPFGGEKRSSQGPREQGRAVRELMTRTTTITVAPPASPDA